MKRNYRYITECKRDLRKVVVEQQNTVGIEMRESSRVVSTRHVDRKSEFFLLRQVEVAQLLERVDDVNLERTADGVLAGPQHVHLIDADLGRVVAAQNAAVAVRLTRHFHAECAFRSTNFDRQLARAGSASVHLESTLERCQQSVAYPIAGDPDPAWIGSCRHFDAKWTAWHRLTTIFDAQNMHSSFLWSYQQLKSSIMSVY